MAKYTIFSFADTSKALNVIAASQEVNNAAMLVDVSTITPSKKRAAGDYPTPPQSAKKICRIRLTSRSLTSSAASSDSDATTSTNLLKDESYDGDQSSSPSPVPKPASIWSTPNPITGAYDLDFPKFRTTYSGLDIDTGLLVTAEDDDGIPKKLRVHKSHNIVWVGRDADAWRKRAVDKYARVRYFWRTEDSAAFVKGYDDKSSALAVLFRMELESRFVRDWVEQLLGPADWARVEYYLGLEQEKERIRTLFENTTI